MLDRLDEFRKLAQKEGVSLNLQDSLIEEEENNDRELISDFLVKVKDVQKRLVQMEKNNGEMKVLANKQINENKSANQQRQEYQKNIKQYLDQMNEEIKENEKKFKDEPEIRVMKTVHQTLTSKFRDVLRQSQSIQTDFKNDMQQKIKRQLRIAKADATEEELDQLARDPEAAQQAIKAQLFGPAHKKIQNTVLDIQNKYKDILKLEQSVEELFQLFQELATLIQAQGEMLDNIEANLEDANDYLEKAEKNLDQAKKWHQKTRTKMCCIMICLLVVLCVLLFGVFKVQG